MAASDYIPCDAWDMEDDPGGGRDPYDPLHYHYQVTFTRIVERNRHFWVLDIPGKGIVYVPKSICRHMRKKKRMVLVHRKTYQAILSRQDTVVALLPNLTDDED